MQGSLNQNEDLSDDAVIKRKIDRAKDLSTAITKQYNLRQNIVRIVSLYLGYKPEIRVPTEQSQPPAQHVEKIQTPIELPTGSFSIKSPDHANHDVHGMKTFIRPDGSRVDRYVVGDGSGGSGGSDDETRRKMIWMKYNMLESTGLSIGDSLKLADEKGRSYEGAQNKSYGVMAGVDVIRKNGEIKRIEISNAGDAVVMGWKPGGFDHRRGKRYKTRGDASQFMAYSFSHNLAHAKKEGGVGVRTGELDTDADANQVYKVMGDSSAEKPVEPEEYALDAGEIDFPQIIMLITDGAQPATLTDPDGLSQKFVNKLLSDYVSGQSKDSLDEIAKRISIFARTELNDKDDISVRLVDVR